MITQEEKLSRLIESIKLLASSFEIQLKTFPVDICVPDEIALIYDDNFVFTNELVQVGLISKDQLLSLDLLNNSLSKMSDFKDYWTLEALKSHVEWDNVRSVAKDKL